MNDDKIGGKKLPGKKKPPILTSNTAVAAGRELTGKNISGKDSIRVKLPGQHKSPDITLTRGIAPATKEKKDAPLLPKKQKTEAMFSGLAPVAAEPAAGEDNADQEAAARKLAGLRKYTNLTMKRGIAAKQSSGKTTPATLPDKRKPPAVPVKKALVKKAAKKKSVKSKITNKK